MPLFLLPVIAGAKSFFSAVFAFCSKPPGSWIAAAVMVALALWWMDDSAFHRGQLKCETAHAEAAANEVARQHTVATVVATRSDARTAKSDVINKGNEKVIIHVKDQAEIMPGASDECVPAAIADGLRDLK